jgi:hypothetical protein
MTIEEDKQNLLNVVNEVEVLLKKHQKQNNILNIELYKGQISNAVTEEEFYAFVGQHMLELIILVNKAIIYNPNSVIFCWFKGFVKSLYLD